MKTSSRTTDRNSPPTPQYALRRGVGYWAVAFEGREAIFKHELGALYVAYLLLNPPLEPIHAVALALKARERAGQVAEPDEVVQERGVQAVTAAIKRFHDRLVGAVDAEGKPDPVLRAFARHLYEYLLIPSGRGCGRAGSWAVPIPAGCFTYEPPPGVVWAGKKGLLPK